KAKSKPTEKIRVIIQSTGGADGAGKAFKGLGTGGSQKRLDLVSGVAVELPARLVTLLSKIPGLTVTPDDVVQVSEKSDQVWPYETGNSQLWTGDKQLYNKKLPTIAVVDSGIDTSAGFNFGN